MVTRSPRFPWRPFRFHSLPQPQTNRTRNKWQTIKQRREATTSQSKTKRIPRMGGTNRPEHSRTRHRDKVVTASSGSESHPRWECIADGPTSCTTRKQTDYDDIDCLGSCRAPSPMTQVAVLMEVGNEKLRSCQRISRGSEQQGPVRHPESRHHLSSARRPGKNLTLAARHAQAQAGS